MMGGDLPAGRPGRRATSPRPRTRSSKEAEAPRAAEEAEERDRQRAAKKAARRCGCPEGRPLPRRRRRPDPAPPARQRPAAPRGSPAPPPAVPRRSWREIDRCAARGTPPGRSAFVARRSSRSSAVPCAWAPSRPSRDPDPTPRPLAAAGGAARRRRGRTRPRSRSNAARAARRFTGSPKTSGSKERSRSPSFLLLPEVEHQLRLAGAEAGLRARDPGQRQPRSRSNLRQ